MGYNTEACPRVHSVLRYCDVEIHRTARKHGIDNDTIRHAIDHTLVLVDLDPDSDPPKVLAIGPDRAGNLLEVIWLELADDAKLVIHAMRLRAAFYDLVPTRHGEDAP
jgi:hypothetical protein